MKLMTGALKSVLSTAIAKSEGQVQQMHIVHANRSLLRIDYYVYWKTYKNKKSLFFYVQVGLLDMASVKLPVLIYELTRATKEENLEEVGDKLNKMAEATRRLGDKRISRDLEIPTASIRPPGVFSF